MEDLGPFQYWTLWMSKRHNVILHHVITVYNSIFNHMDGVMWASAKKKTQWKEDFFFAMRLVWQKLSKYYAEVTATTGMHLISAHILNPFRKLPSFKKLHKGMHINPEDEISYTIQYQDAFLKNVENEYCAKQQCVPVNKPKNVRSTNLVPSPTASGSGQSSFDPYDLSSNNEEYLKSNNVAKTTPRQSNCAALLLTTARLYLNSPFEAPKN